jgi:diaminopimelate decarboxylase
LYLAQEYWNHVRFCLKDQFYIKQTPVIKSNLSTEEMSAIFSIALKDKTSISPDDSAVIFYNLSFVEERINGIKKLFPQSALHAIAVKANPLTKILSKIKAIGVGAEVASLPELHLAEMAGFAPENIVFDSPCKTRAEIEYALRAGVYLNADSFDELERIDEILKTVQSKSIVGLRINPQVGAGTIKSTSVAGSISKFGVPVTHNRDKITAYFLKYNWLRGIHVHIGSQGCPVPLVIEGIRKVLDLALEINKQLKLNSNQNRIDTFDIGGGLPVSYYPGVTPIAMDQYVAMLKDTCAELFNGQFRLITEFGRYIYANAGWVASKVEYVKREPGCNIIITHVGADLFLRKSYNPEDWHHQITVVDKKGMIKTGTDTNKYMVAGPLCFAGDVIARDLELPVVNEGDYILIHDAGAYTLSMWSRYNSRQMPKVIGYSAEGEDFESLMERESKEDLFEFWS